MARLVSSLVRLFSLVLVISLFGCSDQLKQCQQDLTTANDRVQELQKLYDQAERARMAAEDEVTALKAERDRLKGELAKKPEGWDKVPGGALINIEGDILFDSGKAELRKEGMPTLDKITDAIKQRYPNHEIYIFGHTDNDPIEKSNWKDNYELSCQRSLTVLRYLKNAGVRNYLAACGWGETRPAQTNDTEEGKQANRRVQIFALDPKLRGQ
ncbi:MAG TPA: OmpA family protein [Phycisphaerae bacterium]|nr:OmpA family protein [Phycisphaerae bacterium]HRR83531.1 OmpA family protein [Phycisphaerae bacterium]